MSSQSHRATRNAMEYIGGPNTEGLQRDIEDLLNEKAVAG